MPGAHRQDDSRDCGASTVVEGQSTVFADSKLWAVEGDPNTDGDGGLIPSGDSVFIEGKLVIVKGDSAQPDALCPIAGGAHCDPKALGASGDVFAYG